MREIKFRAWDTESNIMVYSDKRNKKDWDCDYFFQQDDGGNMICYWDYDYDDSFGEPTHNCGELDNLMQYTGLKDKNGVEIYEGDIVKIHITDGRINSVEKDYMFEVVWCFSEASFEYKTKADILGNPCCEASNQHRVEVIGNIYENPDLLEALNED
jgi:uncharacterized phage protein (TIGR01671 family)